MREAEIYAYSFLAQIARFSLRATARIVSAIPTPTLPCLWQDARGLSRCQNSMVAEGQAPAGLHGSVPKCRLADVKRSAAGRARLFSARNLVRKPVPTFRDHALMPLEGNQRAHRHVHLAQFLGAAEFGQIDDETGGQHFGAEKLRKMDVPVRTLISFE